MNERMREREREKRERERKWETVREGERERERVRGQREGIWKVLLSTTLPYPSKFYTSIVIKMNVSSLYDSISKAVKYRLGFWLQSLKFFANSVTGTYQYIKTFIKHRRFPDIVCCASIDMLSEMSIWVRGNECYKIKQVKDIFSVHSVRPIKIITNEHPVQSQLDECHLLSRSKIS